VQAHSPLIEQLQRLSKGWNVDVCRGASELRAFFCWYLDLVRWRIQMPFFVHEYLRISLQKIDWHAVALKVLGTSLPDVAACTCEARTQEIFADARIEYLGELFKQVGNEAAQLGRDLPEPERMQALLLSDLCRETTSAMRQSLAE
jgi:hypothetical protein